MKKPLLLALSMGFFLTGKAQMIDDKAVIIDVAEDTTQVTTINDIIVTQEMVNKRNTTDAHIASVWSRKSYFNPGYVTSKLTSKEPISLNSKLNEDITLESKWGAQIQLGHSYTLHKGAIANMVQINLDFTYIDLSAAQYKQNDNLLGKFDPNDTFTNSNSGYICKYNAWGAKDTYAVTYGMSLGPSVTVAPLTMLDNKALHFIKLNAYFHIGYNIGGIFYNYKYTNKQAEEEGGPVKETREKMSNILWGPGMSTAFGFSVSWKSIGIGWETSTASIKYQNAYPAQFGKEKTHLKNSQSRIYLSIKY